MKKVGKTLIFITIAIFTLTACGGGGGGGNNPPTPPPEPIIPDMPPPTTTWVEKILYQYPEIQKIVDSQNFPIHLGEIALLDDIEILVEFSMLVTNAQDTRRIGDEQNFEACFSISAGEASIEVLTEQALITGPVHISGENNLFTVWQEEFLTFQNCQQHNITLLSGKFLEDGTFENVRILKINLGSIDLETGAIDCGGEPGNWYIADATIVPLGPCEKTPITPPTKIIILRAIADAFTSKFQPDTGWGKNEVLGTGDFENQPGSDLRAFVIFDTDVLKGESIVSATLELTTYPSGETGTTRILTVPGPWDENTLTYNTQPPVTNTSQYFEIVSRGVFFNGEKAEFNVINIVIDWANNKPNYGLAIRTEINNYPAYYASSESGHGPILIVEVEIQ
jgi:hypothetical protein